MTATSEVIASAPAPIPLGHSPDRRGSWIPTGGMIATRFMELRKRRGLMVALIFVTIGIPTVFLTIRLLAHAFAPKSYGPAGGEDIFNALVAGVLYVFGFIVAATLGCTAGSVDLTEGMFRHLVVTGRSRLALYLARIPAGLAIVVPLVAIGFTIVCAVCVFAAPTQINYQGVNLPAGLSEAGLQHWAADHPNEVVCDFPYRGSPPNNVVNVLNNVPCGGPGGGPGIVRKGPPGSVHHADTGDDQGRRGTGRRSGLFGLLQGLSVPFGRAHGPHRPLDRARGHRRLHRRARARISARTAHRRRDPDDRPGDRHHPDPDTGQHPPHDQSAAFGGRAGRSPSGTVKSRVRLRWGRRT